MTAPDAFPAPGIAEQQHGRTTRNKTSFESLMTRQAISATSFDVSKSHRVTIRSYLCRYLDVELARPKRSANQRGLRLRLNGTTIAVSSRSSNHSSYKFRYHIYKTISPPSLTMRPFQTIARRFYSASATNMAAKKLQVGWVSFAPQ